MIAWIKKRLGYHVCEEFTQWQEHEIECRIVPNVGGLPIESFATVVTRRFQERRCTLCGKIEQRSLKVAP